MFDYKRISDTQSIVSKLTLFLNNKFPNDSLSDNFKTNLTFDILQTDSIHEYYQTPSNTSISSIGDYYLNVVYKNRKNTISKFLEDNTPIENFQKSFDTPEQAKNTYLKEKQEYLNKLVFYNPYLMNYLDDSSISFEDKMNSIHHAFSGKNILTQNDFDTAISEKEMDNLFR